MGDTERRAFSRIPFDANTTIRQGEHCWSVELIDVSLKGLLVEEQLALGINRDEPISATIRLGNNNDNIITMTVRFRHQEDQQIGFECTKIDIESIGRLRRLIELNLGDPSLLERELASLGQEPIRK